MRLEDRVRKLAKKKKKKKKLYYFLLRNLFMGGRFWVYNLGEKDSFYDSRRKSRVLVYNINLTF